MPRSAPGPSSGDTVASGSHRKAGLVVALSLLWLSGAALRLPILALPPVLDQTTAALKLTPVEIGLLTATPSFFFAAAAIPGAILIGRTGALACLLVGLVLDGLGAAARGFVGDVWGLELATAAMAFGVALMQPAMPVLVRGWAPRQVGLASAAYTFGLLLGEIAPVVWPVRAPVLFLRSAWQAQLFVWSMPVAMTAAAAAFAGPRMAAGRLGDGRASPWPDWSRPEVWWNGALMGAVGSVFFGLNGFVPGWLKAHGHAGDSGGVLMALNLAQLPAALLMMAVAERWAFRAPIYVAAGAALLVSAVVLAGSTGQVAILAAGVAGFCLAVLLALVLTVQPLVAEADSLPALSAGAFTIGFGIAVMIALLTGWIEASGPAWGSIAPIAAACLAILGFGATIGRLSRPGAARRDR